MIQLILFSFFFFFFEKASSDGNATVSILSFRPKMDNIGKSLVCKATNPLITQSDLFDSMDLNIDCKYCTYHFQYCSLQGIYGH